MIETTLDKVKPGDLLMGSGRSPRRVTRTTAAYVFYRWYELPLEHGNFMINCPNQLAAASQRMGLKGVETSGDMYNGSGKVPIRGNERILQLSAKEGKIKIHGRFRGVPNTNWDYVVPVSRASISWDFYLG